MKYPIRYFSIGLFTASLILLIGYYFFEPKTTLPDHETVDEMVDNIEKEGYRVISESEYISLATAKNELNTLQTEAEEENDKKADNQKTDKNKTKDTKEKKNDDKKKNTDKKTDKKKDKKKDSKKKNDVKTYTLVVEENMLPSMISEKLEKNKIIKDATKFSKFMEDNNYSPYLQIGEFKLKSDMSMEQIAKAITNK